MITKQEYKQACAAIAYLAAIILVGATLSTLGVAWIQWLAGALGIK